MSAASFERSQEPGRLVVAEVADGDTGERLSIQRLTAIPEVELIDVYNSQRLWRVFHEGYDLCVVPLEDNDPSGFSNYWYRGRMHQARSGGVMFTEPGEVHDTRRMVRPAVHYWILQIESEFMNDSARELGVSAPPHLRLALTFSREMLHAFSRFYDAIHRDEGALEQQTRFLECIRLMLSECAEGSPGEGTAVPSGSLTRAREYLHAHFREQVRLDELAAVAGISRFHLAHAFQRELGLPPHAYQNALRVAEARLQLRAGIRPANVDVGFADQSHLTRHFKRVFGINPAEYARAVRGELHPHSTENPFEAGTTDPRPVII